MNAYELADELQELDAKLHLIDLFKSAVMLRQQADRIAELEKDLHMIERHYDQLNTQTKPLNDEEIYKLWCEADNTELLPEMRLKDGSINYIITTFAKLIEERLKK